MLTPEDLDWPEGLITRVGRAAILNFHCRSMSEAAIADYLRHGRPTASSGGGNEPSHLLLAENLRQPFG
jgi:hypothetical protein